MDGAKAIRREDRSGDWSTTQRRWKRRHGRYRRPDDGRGQVGDDVKRATPRHEPQVCMPSRDDLYSLVTVGTLAYQCLLCGALLATGDFSEPHAREQHRMYHASRGEMPGAKEDP